MKPTQNRDQRLGVYKDSFGNSFDVVQIQNGHAGSREWLIARHRDDMAIGYVKRRTSDGLAKDLQLWMRLVFIPFNQHKIARAQSSKEFGQRSFGLIGDLVNLHPTACRRHDHLARAGFAMLVGIFARMIDIEGVMGMF